MPDRNAQANAVTSALSAWLSAVEAFDAAHAADVAALSASNDAFHAYNNVAWKLQDHSGASEEEKIAALQAKLAYNAMRSKYDAAFNATMAASSARNDARNTLVNAVAALDTNPGESENISGTVL